MKTFFVLIALIAAALLISWAPASSSVAPDNPDQGCLFGTVSYDEGWVIAIDGQMPVPLPEGIPQQAGRRVCACDGRWEI